MVKGEILKGKIHDRGYTIKDVAVRIGTDESTFYRKLRNSEKSFSVEEAKAIKDLLGLTANETTHIFFA